MLNKIYKKVYTYNYKTKQATGDGVWVISGITNQPPFSLLSLSFACNHSQYIALGNNISTFTFVNFMIIHWELNVI